LSKQNFLLKKSLSKAMLIVFLIISSYMFLDMNDI